MLLRSVMRHFRNQEWTAIGLDFAVVVIGILIAFQITTWSEQRQERAREQEYLGRIAAELDNTILEIEDAITLTNERQALGEFLLRSIEDPELVRADPATFFGALIFSGYTFSPRIRSYAFDEMRSAGELSILRDRALRYDLTEFYTKIRGNAQWGYLRELGQTEYTKRSAGILTYEQQRAIAAARIEAGALEPLTGLGVDAAMAAHDRMMARPDFIEWLPVVTLRLYELETYSTWLREAHALRGRIDVGATTAPATEPAP